MRVRFTKRVAEGIGRSTSDLHLEHTVDLPFAPFPGLTVVDGEWEAAVKRVIYWTAGSQDGEEIECETDTDRPGLLKLRSEQEVWEAAKPYIDQGWREVSGLQSGCPGR